MEYSLNAYTIITDGIEHLPRLEAPNQHHPHGWQIWLFVVSGPTDARMTRKSLACALERVHESLAHHRPLLLQKRVVLAEVVGRAGRENHPHVSPPFDGSIDARRALVATFAKPCCQSRHPLQTRRPHAPCGRALAWRAGLPRPDSTRTLSRWGSRPGAHDARQSRATGAG